MSDEVTLIKALLADICYALLETGDPAQIIANARAGGHVLSSREDTGAGEVVTFNLEIQIMRCKSESNDE